MEPTTTTTSGTTQRTPPPSPPTGGDTDTKMAIYTSTITPSTLFSPLKRKREGLPLPPPPAAWQEEEEEEGGETEPEGSSHSGRLARQLEGLSLGQVKFPLDARMACEDGVVVDDGDDRNERGEERDGNGRVVGKRTRLVSPPLTLGRGGGGGSSSGDEEAGNTPVPHPVHGHQEGAAEEEEGEEDSDWGLSGVGVKPSARQSYIRAQKKLQQIREYKSRVSKEAREKRSWERRRRKSFTNGNTTAAAAVTKGLTHRSEGEEDEEDFRGRRKRVHFDV